jgi:PAS domain S-box-containing protein
VGKVRSFSIRARVTTIALAVLCLSIAVVIAATGYVFRDAYTHALQTRSIAIGNSLKVQLDRLLHLGIPVEQLIGFEAQCREAVLENPGIAYALVTTPDGRILFHSDPAGGPDNIVDAALLSALPVGGTVMIEAGSSHRHYASVVALAPRPGISGASIVVGLAEASISDKVREMTLAGLGVGFVALGIATILLLTAISMLVTNPLARFVDDIGRIRTGGLAAGRIEHAGTTDEAGKLANAFNDLLDRIEARDQELQRYRHHLEEEVAERTEELQQSNARLETDLIERRKLSEALSQLREAIVITDTGLRITYVNPAFTQLFGYAENEIVGAPLSLLAPPDDRTAPAPAEVARMARETGGFHGEVRRRAKSGALIPVLINVAPVKDAAGSVVNYVGAMSDLTELKHAEAEIHARMAELARINDRLSQAQGQLLQSEKMASIGLLAAGVAHEINNPVGFIKSNYQTLKTYVEDYDRIVDAYGEVERRDDLPAQAFSRVRRLMDEADFAYVRQDIRQLLSESGDGIDRVVKIIRDLRDFSRIDNEETFREEDIHQGLESTLNVVWNQLKYTCEIRREYADLPPVECVLSQLNQVFMNLFVNAAQAIERHGTITIRTGTRDDRVWVEIADTGTGIAPEQLQRIFDPFFTTKPVGKGTGLGLSVSYSIIQKHHGSIEVESRPGSGTTFRIWLPVRQPPRDEAAAVARAA